MIIDEKNCSGCGACKAVCPFGAIIMTERKGGFLYPEIDSSKCRECGLCEKVCTSNFNSFTDSNKVKAYVGTARDTEVLMKSSSGGAFSVLYEYYVSKGFVVYGVCFDDNLNVVVDRAETLAECEKFRKSKFIQANVNDYFLRVENDLKSDVKVLFSGVSCQIASLLSYLKVRSVPTDNLVTINVLCHGVSSKKIFDEYIQDLEKRKKVA